MHGILALSNTFQLLTIRFQTTKTIQARVVSFANAAKHVHVFWAKRWTATGANPLVGGRDVSPH